MQQPFYFKRVIIDNYSDIISEVRAHVLSQDWTDKFGWHTINAAALLDACPTIRQFFARHKMVLRLAGIIIMRPQGSNAIHIDWVQDEFSKLALNMDILNCETVKTRFFYTDSAIEFARNPAGVPYCRFPADAKFTPVAAYDLSTPVLLDTQQPHQVRNTQDRTRISISFRFFTDPDL